MAPTLNNTIGSIYVGVVISAMFFGISIIQTYHYYVRYPNDWKVYKVSVAVLWILDALHLYLTIHIGYSYLIDNFGNFQNLDIIVWSQKAQVAFNVIIILFVQSLYVLRVWKLGSNHGDKFIPCIVTASVAGGYALGIIVTVFTYRVDKFSKLGQIGWSIKGSLIAATLDDFVIAAAMVYYLRKSKSGFSSSNTTVTTLIQHILGSGLVTSASSLLVMLTYVAMPREFIFIAIDYSLTKLYFNSFLAMLNARKTIGGNHEHGLSLSLTDLRSHTPSRSHSCAAAMMKTKKQLGPQPPDVFAVKEGKTAFVWPGPGRIEEV